jgi:AraC-like DNA-binding protein
MSWQAFSTGRRSFIPERLSYKLLVTICISLLVGFFVLIAVANSALAIRSYSLEMSEREAQLTTDNMVSEIEDKLDILHQYYLYSAMDEDIEWFLDNKLDYSDYDRYKQISAALGNESMFPNYLNSYVIVNNNNGRVISSRGIYDLKEMINREEIERLYEDNSSRVNKGNWIYIRGGTRTDSLSHGYRLTCDTDGINFLLNLPIGSYTSKGFIQVNLNMDEWKKWILDEINISGKHVVVLDENSNVIYSTNSSFCDSCKKSASIEGISQAHKENIGGKNYIVADCTSSIFGWRYFVAYDYDTILGATSKLLTEFLLAILVFALVFFLFFRYVLYHPVDRLIREVTDDGDPGVKGNELQYLAGQFKDLKTDRELLNRAVMQNKEKLRELFEIRIIRSSVSTADEWDEYIKVLDLDEYPHYAVAAIVLNLKDEENMEEDINEDAICLQLCENLPEHLKDVSWLPLIYDSCTLTCIFAAGSEEELMEKIASYYESLKKYVLENSGFAIQMGVSEAHTRWNHLGRAYHECIYALTMDTEEVDNGSHSDGKLADEDCRFYIKPAPSAGQEVNLKRYEKDICDALKSMDKGTCYRLLDEFTDNLKLVGDLTVASIYLTSLLDCVMIQAVDMQIDTSSFCPEGLHSLYRNIIDVGDVSRMRKNMKKLVIDPILKARMELLENNSYNMMAQIEQKLSDTKGNITLNECADELNVTPTYIWKIMKAERGKTFSEYQEEYKLEEAKKLLQTGKSVSEIAEILGYTNAQNFIRFFSKGTGLTPGKYRKLIYGSV